MSKRETPAISSPEKKPASGEAGPGSAGLVQARRDAIRKLLEKYDGLMAEADRHANEPLGLEILDRAEAVLGKADQVKAATTLKQVEALMKEKVLDFSVVAKEQAVALTSRRGLEIDFKPPETELSAEQLSIFLEIFGPKNLEPVILPTAEQFNDQYVAALYSKAETADDKAHGLINHTNIDAQDIASIKATLTSLQEKTPGKNTVLLQETVTKPNYTNGSQLYTIGDKDADPLLPLIKQVFATDEVPNPNRFGHSWDDLTQRLIPKIKEKLLARFKDQGLPAPTFDLILAPAVSFNLQTVLAHPENSKTNTWEWSADVRLDSRGKDSGSRLNVGRAGDGGAGRVGDDHRGRSDDYGGFRLAVVLGK